jgi:hypothetical protein
MARRDCCPNPKGRSQIAFRARTPAKGSVLLINATLQHSLVLLEAPSLAVLVARADLLAPIVDPPGHHTRLGCPALPRLLGKSPAGCFVRTGAGALAAWRKEGAVASMAAGAPLLEAAQGGSPAHRTNWSEPG